MKLTATHDAQLIGGYRDKRTRSFAVGQSVKAFDGIARKLSAKLDELNAATSLRDLDLPGNRLEALKGDRKGEYSAAIEGREVIEIKAGDLFYVPAGPPGHDSWVVGDEPYVSLHFLGASAYATQKR